jgi:hypothetical protein
MTLAVVWTAEAQADLTETVAWWHGGWPPDGLNEL